MDWLGKCYCPSCEQALPGRLLVDDHVWLIRRCPEHGLFKTMLFESPSYFARAVTLAMPGVRQPGAWSSSSLSAAISDVSPALHRRQSREPNQQHRP
jgi:uncharacterized radical SAM superfamily Fe-S cluster-containing enzyme